MSDFPSQDWRDPEHCLPQIHRWRPMQFDGPMTLHRFAGLRCYCGLQMLMVHECECGNQHLRQVQTGSVKIDGGVHGQTA